MTLKNKDPKTIALQFNDCINNRDPDNLAHLMTDDHTFIDKEENQFNGKQKCTKSWNEFFNLFPDYKNIFETVTSKDDIVIMQGYSRCSEKLLDGKAIWTAKIRDNKISELRVYMDTTDIRRQLKLII